MTRNGLSTIRNKMRTQDPREETGGTIEVRPLLVCRRGFAPQTGQAERPAEVHCGAAQGADPMHLRQPRLCARRSCLNVYVACTSVQRIWPGWRFWPLVKSTTYVLSAGVMVRFPPPPP